MGLKLSRRQSGDKLIVERFMYTKHYSLVLDRKRCIGCEICKIICPKEAITVCRPTKTAGQKLNKPTIFVDEKKCSFCGMCTAICPFNAFELALNGEKWVPVLDKESFPKLIHEITVNESLCPPNCVECEKACPFELVKVAVDKSSGSVKVEIDKEHCPCCRLCELKCPYEAISVKQIFTGTISINDEKCPENCHDCVDVCPIPEVLSISNKGKVRVDVKFCVYCGACKVVCPVEDAISLQRSSVKHTPIHSGAWNKALEKLTAIQGVTKELRTITAGKARESVKRLLKR